MTNLTPYLQLLRPAQWIKNVFVFLPMFFSGNMLIASMWGYSLAAFFAFSFAASAIYCLNDIRDVEADKIHQKKRLRPIASGAVKVSSAYILMAISAILSLLTALLLPWGIPSLASIIALYLVLNVAYCFKLKQVAIIDVFTVSIGFVLRILAGGIACGIWVSPWLACMTFILALFLAFAKRRDDVIIREQTGVVVRKNILGYNSSFLNQTLGILAAVMMMCYIIYAVSPAVTARFNCEYLYVTSVFVLAGILRYLQVAMVETRSGSPTKVLLHDRFLQIDLLCWIITFITIIYL